MKNNHELRHQDHPRKTNTLSLGIICVLILILSMQIWLLTAALNTALEGNEGIKWPALGASILLFLSGAALIPYLPDPIRRAKKSSDYQKKHHAQAP